MLAEVYKKYRTELYNFVFNQTREKETVWDIIHDVFCSLCEQTAEIHNPRAWLYAATRNAIIDYARRMNRQKIGILSDAEYGGEYHLNPERLLIKKEEILRVRIGLEVLGDVDREILQGNIDGLSSKEVANNTGLSENNVRVRLHRIRRTLQEKLV